MKFLRQICVALLVGLFLTAAVSSAVQEMSSDSDAVWDQQTPDELHQLVAPIALYPDALVAQVLSASLNPTEIADAAKWMNDHKKWTGEKLAGEVNKQKWDPSVKALTQFPSVLQNMNQNLSWTSSLGEAYSNQPQDVQSAIQFMRQQAQKAGNLTSNSQQTVTSQGSTIVIEPAQPQVVYVPTYNPWAVYGPPMVAYPGWVAWPGVWYGGPGVYWGGPAFNIGFWGGYGWGWGHWGYNWGGGNVIWNQNIYINNNHTYINNNGFRPNGWQPNGNHTGWQPYSPYGPKNNGNGPTPGVPNGGNRPGWNNGTNNEFHGFTPNNTYRGWNNGNSNNTANRWNNNTWNNGNRGSNSQNFSGMRSGAFNGFGRGGNTQGFASRGFGSFGGARGAGGFGRR